MPVTSANTGTFNLGGPVIRGLPQYYNSGSSGVGATFTVAKDASVQPGDAILVFMAWNGTGTNPAMTGFTSYTKTTNVFGIALFSRVADGSEGSTFTVTFAAGFNVAAVCVAYRGSTGVLDPVPANSGTITLASSAVHAPSITTSVVNDTMVWFGASRANGASAPTPALTVPRGLVQEGRQSSTTAAASANISVLLADALAQTAGATGDMDGTASVAVSTGAILLALQSSAGVPVSALAGLAAASGAALLAAAGGTNAHAGLAAATAAALDVAAGLGTIVGAYIDETQYGLTSTTAHHAQAIASWQSNSGRVMACERLYEGVGQLPSTIPTNAAACVSAGRMAILSFKPNMFGFASPLGGGTSQASLDTAFNTCMAGLVSGGLNASNSIIPLWHEPITTGHINSSTDFIAMFQHYAPLVHSHGLVTCFCTAAGTVWANNENSYYPGDAYCDIVCTDWYFPQYGYGGSPPAHPLGSGLSTDPAMPADTANPPKPFGILEFNNSTEAPIGVNGTTLAQAQGYWHYLRDYFQARLAAGQPCAPLVMFNSDSGSANPRDSCVAVADGVTDPYGTPTVNGGLEYRNALIADLIDTLAAVT